MLFVTLQLSHEIPKSNPANQILKPNGLSNRYKPFVKITVIIPELFNCNCLWLSKHEEEFQSLKLTLRLCFGTLISDFKLFNRVLLWPITSSSSVEHIWFISTVVITFESFNSSPSDHIFLWFFFDFFSNIRFFAIMMKIKVWAQLYALGSFIIHGVTLEKCHLETGSKSLYS